MGLGGGKILQNGLCVLKKFTCSSALHWRTFLLCICFIIHSNLWIPWLTSSPLHQSKLAKKGLGLANNEALSIPSSIFFLCHKGALNWVSKGTRANHNELCLAMVALSPSCADSPASLFFP